METNNDEKQNDVETLSAIFQEGLDSYNNIVNSDQPTNSDDLQVTIKRTMKTFERATILVSLSNLFSKNESIDEISTNDLRYFLLPALLGSLALKLTGGERKDIVDVAEVYFKDFLKRCNEYGLSNYQFKEKEVEQQGDHREKSEFEKLEFSVNNRANKIQRFKEQKELESKLEDLKKNVANEHVDDEIKRNYFLTMIKLFITQSIDELNSIDMEKPILEHMAKLKKEDKPSFNKRAPPRNPPLKPIIITKNEMQKSVFGAGYPSLPVMTVEEFYEKRVREGIFPDPCASKSSQNASMSGMSSDDKEEKEKEDNEKMMEEENDEYIARMRAKDEFKDDHRRGWGNRMNRS